MKLLDLNPKLRRVMRVVYSLRSRMKAAARRPFLVRRIPALASIDPAKPVYVFLRPLSPARFKIWVTKY
jgi:hypothetical protein